MRDICRFLRIDIQAPASLPISLIRNTDETITLLARMARLVGRTLASSRATAATGINART
jgi:hypothetical protein